MKYEQTLMYGKYKEDLAATARREAERLKHLREQQQLQQQQQQQQQQQKQHQQQQYPPSKEPPPPFDSKAASTDAAAKPDDAAKEEAPSKKDQFTAWDCWYGCLATLRHCRMFFFRYVGEDWFFLVMLGVLMACVSFVIDSCIEFCHEAQ